MLGCINKSLCPLGICVELRFLGMNCLFLVPHSFKLFQTSHVQQATCRQEEIYLVKITTQQPVSVGDILPIAPEPWDTGEKLRQSI